MYKVRPVDGVVEAEFDNPHTADDYADAKERETGKTYVVEPDTGRA